MKFRISKLPLFIVISFCIITCQTPSENKNPQPVPGEWLQEMTVAQMREGYESGKFTIKDVVSAYIDRIQAIDKNGPNLNSIIIINPDALAIADELDREMKNGKARGPLHGIPVILKDNIDTHDKMPNTAGSLALAKSYPENDSYIAAKLREAGAVILGKANLSEWANFRSETSSSGWSGIAGQTKNPYVLDRNPCGSSSGSAVAVSANLCTIAIGTETNGSIVCPANNNGIVGLKPTVGLISRSGIIPISFTQDTPGPMGRTVEDVAITLGTLTGIDPQDTKTLLSEVKAEKDYTKYLNKKGLERKKIGLLKEAMGFSFKVDTLIYEAKKFLEANGATVVDVVFPSDKYSDASMEVMLYEFKDGLNKYLSGLRDTTLIRNLEELIKFNRDNPSELKYFDQKVFEMAQKKGNLDEKDYRKSYEKMLHATREGGIDSVMNANKLDAIMAPTGSPAWKTDLILGDHYTGGSSSLAAIAGYPAITLPMGFIDELPVGITFFGRAWSEGLLLEIAYSYEQGTRYRKAPGFLITD
jgi:amidase